MAPTPIDYLSNINEFVQKQGQGVKGLADMGIKSLPKQYIQPVEERVVKTTTLGDDEDNNDHLIPIIDMSKIDDDEMETLICNAAEKWGFFQVINHGIPLKVLEDVKAATYRFFDLGAEEKSKYLKENSITNSVRYGTSFVPTLERALEWKDYLSLFFVSHEQALTQWPHACRDEVLEYMKSSEMVTKNLLKILMKGLNICEVDERKELVLMGSKRINLNLYPKCPNPELAIGVGRHSDVSTLTILLQDDVGGLHVRGLDGESWIHVPPINGALVVNVGDALQILSNGKYKSVEHRVVANGFKNRVSVPIFVNPTPNIIIGPLQDVIDEDHKPLYKQILYSDYVKNFYNKVHDGKSTIDFAKILNA